LCEDTRNENVPIDLYTEEKLITIQGIFELSVKGQYDSNIRAKIDDLQTFWYDKIREMEIKPEEIISDITEKGGKAEKKGYH
jgi:hypothetical protein